MSNDNSLSDLGSCAQVGKGVEHLIRIQKEHDELKAQFYKDRGALEAKYEKLYQPLYDKRYNIVNAVGVTTDCEQATANQEGENDTSTEIMSIDEIIDNMAKHSKDKIEVDNYTQYLGLVSCKEALKASMTLQIFLLQYEKATLGLLRALRTIKDEIQLDLKFREKGIPDFWFYALKAFIAINRWIKDYDEGALKHLENIKWLRTDNLKVFKLEFYFRPNPFFKNSVLTLTYHMIDEDESIIEKIIGTEIEWYSKNRLKKHRTGSRRSFFNLFNPPEVHNDYNDLELKYILQGNYFIGSIIRDDIIPRAVLWFTGEAKLEQMIEIASRHSCFLNSLSLDVQKHVDHLRNIQKDHDGLRAQFYREKAELEAKYQKVYNNMYNERYLIVHGVVEADKVTNDTEAVNQGVDAPEEKGVPNFWLHALVNHELLDAEISIRDGEALKYLTDIKWLRKDAPKGFILEFCFNKNPFFKNSVLTKTYQLLDEDETILHKAIGIEIEWYPENCLTKECESFFNFFNPLQIDEKAEQEFREDMRRDYYIGSTIRNEIIPRAVLWYVGEAVQGDREVGFKDSEESDEDVDEVSEDEDDESENEDDEEEDGNDESETPIFNY